MKQLPEILQYLRKPEYKFSTRILEPIQPLCVENYSLLMNYAKSLQTEIDITWDENKKAALNNEMECINNYLNLIK